MQSQEQRVSTPSLCSNMGTRDLSTALLCSLSHAVVFMDKQAHSCSAPRRDGHAAETELSWQVGAEHRPRRDIRYKSTFLMPFLKCFDCSKLATKARPLTSCFLNLQVWFVVFKDLFQGIEDIDSAINRSSGGNTVFLRCVLSKCLLCFGKLRSKEQNILRILQFSKCELPEDFQY